MRIDDVSDKSLTQATPAQRKRGGWFYLKRVLLVLVILLIGLPLAGLVYEAVMASGDAQRYPPPGQMVDVGGHRLHINCMGEGSPTVVLESEFAGTSLDWTLVQPLISQTTRTCVYDRGGYGWSDPGPEPRSPQQIAAELHTLLTNAGIEGPYVLVGHSLGGKYVRMFASQYPEAVAGLVLVDARHESVEPVRTPEENAEAREQYKGSLGLYSLLRQLGVARAFGASLLPMLNPVTEHLPSETRSLMAIFAGRQTTLDTMVRESAGSTQDDTLLSSASLGDLPLIVLAAGTSVESDEKWAEAQRMMADLSSNSRLDIVAAGSHTLQWDQPAAVWDTVREVVEAVRTGEPLTR
ncbi:MAG: alpha/beta hydrolase [Anaerolineae bacterium]|nr:alpha/beta hydrolase [Anaerolineae bacterium]